MKSGASSLNPNAASYVPLSKRVVDIKSDTVGGAAKTTEGSMNSAQGHDGRKAWVGSNDHELQCFPGAGNFSLQSYHSQGSSSQHLASLADKLIPEEVYDIHLEYLQMTFPGLSHQSLAEVYLANNGDIDASIDMLNDLEFSPYEFPENLPETLDIGDVAETVPATEHSALKLKNIVGEGADASSSMHHPPPSLD